MAQYTINNTIYDPKEDLNQGDYPRSLVLTGLLSYPTLTREAALVRNENSEYPVQEDKVSPSFQLMITKDTRDTVVDYVNYLLDFEELKHAKTGKGIKPAVLKNLRQDFKAQVDENLYMGPPWLLLRNFNETTQERLAELTGTDSSGKEYKLSDRFIAAVAVNGPRASAANPDVTVMVAVTEESQLTDPSQFPGKPTLVPVEDTIFEQAQPGQVVTVDMQGAVYSGNRGGVTGYTSVIVIKREGYPIVSSEGLHIDEEQVFALTDDI